MLIIAFLDEVSCPHTEHCTLDLAMGIFTMLAGALNKEKALEGFFNMKKAPVG